MGSDLMFLLFVMLQAASFFALFIGIIWRD